MTIDAQSVWYAAPSGCREENSYAAYRARVTATGEGAVKLRLFAPHFYRAWLDGACIMEGPARYALAKPEYDERVLILAPGEHWLAVLLHHDAVAYRLAHRDDSGHALPLALWMEWAGGVVEMGQMEARSLDDAFVHRGLRINPNLGWMEELRSDCFPSRWETGSDSGVGKWEWIAPSTAPAGLGTPLSAPTAPPVQVFDVSSHGVCIGEGRLRGAFELYPEDLAWGFALRDLEPPAGTEEGVWRVYDVGRTRLVRPVVRLTLPENSEVQIGYSERLRGGGHVQPTIFLSNGPSCHLDRFHASRAGTYEFSPVNWRGARFIEIQVSARLAPQSVEWQSVEFLERCSLPEDPLGSFSCSDAGLMKVWRAGWETLRGCAEDALTDCPSRERGQWTGDTTAVGLELLAALSGDVRLATRALHLCAQSARADGLIPARCPAFCDWQSGYPLVWTFQCLRHYDITGDVELLRATWEAAKRNIALYIHATDESGNLNTAALQANYFLDWGYMPEPGDPDLALHFQYLEALRALVRWAGLIQQVGTETALYSETADRVEARLRQWFAQSMGRSCGWEQLGYHAAVLGLRARLIPETEIGAAIAFVKRHILNCFPNNRTAPRMSAPQVANRQLITPYFAHFCFDELLRHGEAEFVHEQWKTCWLEYLLGEGRTTLMELFDDTWSMCHHWSGSPTWQMSRWHLGLWPRADLGENTWSLNLMAGSLEWAEGRLPFPDGSGDALEVRWDKSPAGIQYRLMTPRPVTLVYNGQKIRVQEEWTAEISLP